MVIYYNVKSPTETEFKNIKTHLTFSEPENPTDAV